MSENIFRLSYQDLQVKFNLSNQDDFDLAADVVDLAKDYRGYESESESEAEDKELRRELLRSKVRFKVADRGELPSTWKSLLSDIRLELQDEEALSEPVTLRTLLDDTKEVREQLEQKYQVGGEFSVYTCDNCGQEFESEAGLHGREGGGCVATNREYSGKEERKEAVRDVLSDAGSDLSVSDIAEEIYGEEVEWDDPRYTRVSKVLSEMDDVGRDDSSRPYKYFLEYSGPEEASNESDPGEVDFLDLDREQRKHFLTESLKCADEPLTVDELCKDFVYGESFSSQSTEYKAVSNALEDIERVERRGKDGLKIRYGLEDNEATYVPYLSELIDECGSEREYEIRVHALNKLIPEEGESEEITYSDFRGVYAGDRDDNPKKVWRWFCTSTKFHKAFQVKTGTDLEFSLKKDAETQSMDPLKQYVLEIDRKGDSSR